VNKKRERQNTCLTKSSDSSYATPTFRSAVYSTGMARSRLASITFESDEAVARKLQEEDNMRLGLDGETYAKILQDIEDKKSTVHSKLNIQTHSEIRLVQQVSLGIYFII
jgi:hypothetical protein